jgi:hypothetical protein
MEEPITRLSKLLTADEIRKPVDRIDKAEPTTMKLVTEE